MTEDTFTVNEAESEDWAGFSGAQTDIEDQSLHPAVLVSLERKRLPSQFDASGFAPAIIWTFALEDLEGTTVDGTTSEATGPKSKARPWLEALLGKAQTTALLRGRIDKSALIGRQALVLVAINDNGYPKVSNVLPSQGTRKPEVAPSTAPAPVAAPGPSDALRELVEQGEAEQRRATLAAVAAVVGQCDAFSDEFGRCTRDEGHVALHRNKDKETWA